MERRRKGEPHPRPLYFVKSDYFPLDGSPSLRLARFLPECNRPSVSGDQALNIFEFASIAYRALRLLEHLQREKERERALALSDTDDRARRFFLLAPSFPRRFYSSSNTLLLPASHRVFAYLREYLSACTRTVLNETRCSTYEILWLTVAMCFAGTATVGYGDTSAASPGTNAGRNCDDLLPDP